MALSGAVFLNCLSNISWKCLWISQSSSLTDGLNKVILEAFYLREGFTGDWLVYIARLVFFCLHKPVTSQMTLFFPKCLIGKPPSCLNEVFSHQNPPRQQNPGQNQGTKTCFQWRRLRSIKCGISPPLCLGLYAAPRIE